MSIVRFISDYHFGHKRMAKRRGFKDELEMNEYIVKKHNETVHKKDLTIILGDITMETDKWYFYLDQMNGKKKVILGNHDKGKNINELLKYVVSVHGVLKYKGMFLTHCPIHCRKLESRVRHNIHGDLHEINIPDKRYTNVSCEQMDYKPKTLLELNIKN